MRHGDNTTRPGSSASVKQTLQNEWWQMLHDGIKLRETENKVPRTFTVCGRSEHDYRGTALLVS